MVALSGSREIRRRKKYLELKICRSLISEVLFEKKKKKKENRLTHGSSWKQNMKYDSILFSVFTEYLLCL